LKNNVVAVGKRTLSR